TPDEKERGLTDFNDLHQSRGLAALTEELAPWRQKLLPEPAVPRPELQPTESVIMNDQDNVNSDNNATNDNVNNNPAGQDDVAGQQAAFEEWVASSQDASPSPASVPGSPAEPSEPSEPAGPVKPAEPTEPVVDNTTPAPKKARRTRKTAPAVATGEDKGKTKPAAAARKPRKKKSTPEAVQEKPEQVIPPQAGGDLPVTATSAPAPSGTTEQQSPSSLSSLLTQESPPYISDPATDEEETLPAPAPASAPASEQVQTQTSASATAATTNPAADLKKTADVSGENVQPQAEDDDAQASTPEPDGIKFEKSWHARERIDLVALEGALLHRPGNERGTLQYLLNGERAFTRYMQQGRIIMATPQASQNDRMILGALLVAKQDMVLQGNIELTGSPAFKQRAINLIAEYDLPVKLTSEEQIRMLEAAREKLQSEPSPPDEPTPLGSEASEILVHPGSSPQASSPVSATSASAQRTSTESLPPDILPQKAPPSVPLNASHDEVSSGLTGTLLEHGSAPYNFIKGAGNSYYARLRTAEGERVVWGVELRAAIADAGLKNNDLVTLQMTGRTTVTVEVRQKDKDGKPLLDGNGNVVTRREERERNNWTARQAIDPAVVNADTRQMTPPGEMLAYSLRAYQELQASVEEMAAKAGVSLPGWPAFPDALWMEPGGKGVPAPERQPDRPNLPSPSRHAGQALFQAMDAEGQLKLLLVKAHGDFVQGVVLHEGSYKPVLGKLCKNTRGGHHMTLNEVTADGLRPLGYGNPINNETGSFNDYVFRLNNEPQRLYAQGVGPEKRPAALQQQLGFERAPVAPDQLVVNREPKATHRNAPSTPRPGH
ncbi:hypothetical protein LNU80_005264, partial [Salmonella enterica]|nr:hypothetical protein [Salmonella enterica]